MFGSSLPPVVCRSAHVLFTLFVFVCVEWCPTHMVFCFLFCFSSSCVPYCASFSGLSIFYCPFGILLRLFNIWCLYVWGLEIKQWRGSHLLIGHMLALLSLPIIHWLYSLIQFSAICMILWKYFYSLAPIFVVSTEDSDPFVLKNVVSNSTDNSQ